MKKLLIFLLLFFVLVTRVSAEEIKNFKSQIKVNKDGTIDVKETIVYDFGQLAKHGIFRIIPYIKTNSEGKKFRLDYSNFSVTDESSSPYRYSKSSVDNNLQLKIGDPDRIITGVLTYVISYKVKGALTYFSDHDELYWNITGNDWDVPIVSAETVAVLPDGIKKNDIRVTCYIGLLKSNNQSCEAATENSKVILKTTDYLAAKEGLTVTVGFPIDVVAHLEPEKVISFWDTFLGQVTKVLLTILAVFWYIFLPFHIIYRWYKTGRDPEGTVGVTTAWYDPPKIADGKRFLTPGEVGTLGDETVDLKDISATIVDLARRGHLRIEERDKKDFYLINLKNNKPLLPFERALIDEFFKGKEEIRLKDEHLYEEVEKIKTSLYEQTVTDGLFSKSPSSIRGVYYAIAGVALFTFNIFLALIAFVFGRVMPRKTVEGVNAKNVAFSLKNFLTSQERQLKFQADKQMMFEKLLPYAVAFGVEKIWAKRFESMNLREPDWYRGYSSGHFNSYVFANSLNSSMSSFRSAATPTRSSSGFSSGFSGGFSGGGGGGGGGGSW